MQVTETLSDGLRRGYTVVVPAADIETRRAKRLAELTRDIRLPGFRPGKVPPNLVRKRYGGAVTAEVVEASVQDATRQVLSDRGLRSAGQPRVELGPLEEAHDLEFKVELELLPDISLPDLSGLRLIRLRAEPPAETVDQALRRIARSQRKLEPAAEDHAAETGDVLTVDYRGTVDGEAFAGGTGEGMDVEVGGADFIPGFADQLAGMRGGEARTIHVTFPEAYGVPDLAGKAASFDITVKAVRRGVMPELDDALFSNMGFEGVEDVRRLITQQVQREYDQLSRLRIKRQLLDALAERADFPVPQGMVEAEFGQIWERLETDRAAGRADAEDRNKDEATLKAEYRAIAERRVRLGLLLAEIGRSNGITVAADEMTRAIRAEAARYPGQEQQVLDLFRKNPQAAESLRGPIFEEKVVDYVLELAQVEERTVSPEDLSRDPEAAAEPASATAGAETTAEPGQMEGSAP